MGIHRKLKGGDEIASFYECKGQKFKLDKLMHHHVGKASTVYHTITPPLPILNFKSQIFELQDIISKFFNQLCVQS